LRGFADSTFDLRLLPDYGNYLFFTLYIADRKRAKELKNQQVFTKYKPITLLGEIRKMKLLIKQNYYIILLCPRYPG